MAAFLNPNVSHLFIYMKNVIQKVLTDVSARNATSIKKSATSEAGFTPWSD